MLEFFSCAGASAVSGFFASACSLPFDYVKTQIQKMQPGPDGKYPYTGSVDCAMQTLKNHGPLKFYSGFGTYCVRIAPHVMVSCSLLWFPFISLEPNVTVKRNSHKFWISYSTRRFGLGFPLLLPRSACK